MTTAYVLNYSSKRTWWPPIFFTVLKVSTPNNIFWKYVENSFRFIHPKLTIKPHIAKYGIDQFKALPYEIYSFLMFRNHF